MDKLNEIASKRNLDTEPENDERLIIGDLEYLARKYADRQLPSNFATQKENDITETFLSALEKMVEKKETITIQVNGVTAGGKTVLGLAITSYLNTLYKRPMGLRQIASDQGDLLEMLLESDRKNEAIHIDENNSLLEIGYDSSTFQRILEWYSDVCGQKGVARCSCSPSTMADENTKIILDVIGKDTKRKITIAKISWRLLDATQTQIIPLGHIKINVEKVLNATWYKEQYLEKKFLRMQLVLGEGVKSIKDLSTAGEILFVYNELAPIVSAVKVSYALINSSLDEAKTKLKRFHSIIGEMDIAEKIKGILEIEREKQIYEIKLLKLKEDQEKNREKIIIVERIKIKLDETVKHRIDHLKHLIDVKKKYDEIWRE